MIHKETKCPVVWGTTYNDAVEFLEIARKVLRATNDDLHQANNRIGKLEKSLHHEEHKRNEAVGERKDAHERLATAVRETVKFQKQSDTAREELKALKKKLSDNAIPTRDQRSGRYKKRT